MSNPYETVLQINARKITSETWKQTLLSWALYLLYDSKITVALHKPLSRLLKLLTSEEWCKFPHVEGTETGELSDAHLHVEQWHSTQEQKCEVRDEECACEEWEKKKEKVWRQWLGKIYVSIKIL